jgi:hypothetical protein
MEDWMVYAILAFVFCAIPTAIMVVIVLVIRNSTKAARTRTGTVNAVARAVTSSPQTKRKAASVSKTAAVALAVPAPPEGGFTPIYLNFSNKPRAILESMDSLTAQADKVNATKARWSKSPRLLFWMGLGLMLVEGLIYLLGYTPSCAFLTGGIVLWVIGIFFGIRLRRAQMQAFPPTFKEFEQIIHTLRDDVRPGTGFLGNLDLTGARQSSKVAREASDARGRTTQYFRDQWLNFKAKLYDGNILRVSGIQRLKERKGFTSKGKISGKTKWKPAKFKGSYQELKVHIAVNPDVYKIVRNGEIKPTNQIGEYTVNAVDTEDGIITVLASSPKENVSAQSVLGVLKFAYGLLKLKKA